MIYSKVFQDNNEYDNYINSNDSIFPNLSLCNDTNNNVNIFYNSFNSLKVIKYMASSKLDEVTTDGDAGLHTNKFSGVNGQLTIINHTFKNGHGFIEFDDVITSIGNYAFYNCFNITYILLPYKLKTIGNYAFYGCSSLPNINFRGNITSIGNYAFYGCSILSSIIIPNSITTLGTNIFESCNALSSLTIGTGLTNISTNAFRNCRALSTVIIPNNIKTIGSNAFQLCINLSNLTIGTGVTSIGNSAFSDCIKLADIVIPNNVKTVGGDAFSRGVNTNSISGNQNYRKRITIGSGVTNIGSYTFRNYSKMEWFKILATTPPPKGTSTFDGTNNCPIYVPDASLESYKSTWNNYTARFKSLSEFPI